MQLFLTNETDEFITVHKIKSNKLHLIGSFTRTKKLSKLDVKHLTNIFLTTFGHIPKNCSKVDGTFNPHNNNYRIISSMEELINNNSK